MATLPITPSVLVWALDQAGLSDAEFAASIKVPIDVVDRWKRGLEQPNKTDLQRVAKVLRRPPQVFLLPAPPRTGSFPVSRRSAISGAAEAEGEELAAFRRANRLQGIARWALREDTVAEDQIVFPEVFRSPEKFADEMRSWLEWDTGTQVRAKSKAAVFSALRRAIEDVGVITILDDYGEGAGQGFSLPDRIVPLIFVNSAYSLASVRSYTLLHELAHLARGDSNLHHETAKWTERYCEEFAAAFLLPSGHLKEYLGKGKVSRLERNDPDRVRLVSNRYGCSWRSAELRLRELGLADEELSHRLGIEEKEGGGGPGAEPRTRVVLRHEEFGGVFPRILSRAHDEGKLPALDVMRYLRVNSKELSLLLSRARGGV